MKSNDWVFKFSQGAMKGSDSDLNRKNQHEKARQKCVKQEGFIMMESTVPTSSPEKSSDTRAPDVISTCYRWSRSRQATNLELHSRKKYRWGTRGIYQSMLND